MRRLAALLLVSLPLLLGATAAEAPKTVTLLAAGDIATCGQDGDEKTAKLLDALPGTILALGDTVYERGTDEEYAKCYAPSWGRHRSRTRPVLGNHEYGTPGAAGYFRYFGARAGPRRAGYYSFRLGAWLVVVLNSNCGPAGGCQTGSPQQRWLRSVLARSPRCTVAAMHHPRFSSGLHGSDATLADLWRTLVRGRVDVVLAGHDHHYERFAQQGGARAFVVGTGGRTLYPILTERPRSQVIHAGTHGLLELKLAADRYSWRFVPVAGSSFRDTGSTRCR
jgi:3',5'-cyclic AMP phosphodiesterase CpdA